MSSRSEALPGTRSRCGYRGPPLHATDNSCVVAPRATCKSSLLPSLVATMAVFKTSALYAVPFTNRTFAPATISARQAGPSFLAGLCVHSRH
jgi:hypothetical protein